MTDQYTPLLPYCNNDRQRGLLEFLATGKSQRQAVKAGLYPDLGCLCRALRAVRKRAALAGIAPECDMNKPAPVGYAIKGTSTLYGADGEVKQQWVKTQLDFTQRLELMRESIAETLQDYRGAGGTVKAPKVENRDLMQLIPIGDPHIGMYAWKNECGEDFDVNIACNDLMAGFQMVLDSAPSCDECVIVNLGDYYHADSQENRTSRSGHALDVDSRYARVIGLGNRLMLKLVDAARRKHKRVVVISLPGNHDDHSGVCMSSFIEIFFEKDKRVQVCDSASHFRYHRYGKNLLGFTHGHDCKPTALGEIMACDRKADWSDTDYRYWHTGHIHSNNSMDARGWRWESHRTLAAQDAWSSASGYRSGRDIKGILYHKDYGEVHRSTIDIRAIRAKG